MANLRGGGGLGGGSGSASSIRSSSQSSVLDTFLQIQLGTWTPTSQTARQVLVNNFAPKLVKMNLNEAKLAAMDPKKVTKLLRQVLYEQYLAVPFSVCSFDLEFTGPPSIGDDGVPTQDIVEIAFYDPDRKKLFQQLVLPAEDASTSSSRSKNNTKNSGKIMTEGAAQLTGITDDLLRKEGMPLLEAWNKAVDFVEETMQNNIRERDQGDEMSVYVQQQMKLAAASTSIDMDDGSSLMDGRGGNKAKAARQERLLLVSHGGKLADIAVLNWLQTNVEGARALPGHGTGAVHFGDSLLHIRDLHRRRPVTKDRWPPAWSLEDIALFLGLKMPVSHRAGPDAVMTWEVLYHTLDRYGDDSLAPRQQLVGRFFDQDAKNILAALDDAAIAARSDINRGRQKSGLSLNPLEVGGGGGGGASGSAADTDVVPSFGDGRDAKEYEVQEKQDTHFTETERQHMEEVHKGTKSRSGYSVAVSVANREQMLNLKKL